MDRGDLYRLATPGICPRAINALRGAILKKKSVSGVAAGWLKMVRMGTFFFIVAKKIKISKNGQYFSTNPPPPPKKKKKKKKKNAASLLASMMNTRWTGNRSFFYRGLGGDRGSRVVRNDRSANVLLCQCIMLNCLLGTEGTERGG